MLDLLTKLTPLDNKRIENYIHEWGIEDGYIGNERWLRPWADNKKTLYHLLGGNLIHSTSFTFAKSKTEISNEIKEVCSDYMDSFMNPLRRFAYELKADDFNVFSTNANLYLSDLFYSSTWEEQVLSKSTRTIKLKKNNEKATLQISGGERITKAARKFIEYFDELHDYLKILDELCVRLSLITNEKFLTGDLSFSIHPLDFMTMSDNSLRYGHGWSSCMAWVKKSDERSAGCYHGGTVEMMNSNLVVCVYLSGKDPFLFTREEKKDAEFTWNKKKWRQLFYINKDIIVGGKSYPYANEEMTKAALLELRRLADTNLNWKYKFGPELYKDMRHVGSLYRMDKNKAWAQKFASSAYLDSQKNKKHNIIFDTKSMYNDFFNDNEREYYCVRNKVKRNRVISVSGKHLCLSCGQSVRYLNDDIPYHDEDAYNSRYKNRQYTICQKCRDERHCDVCDGSTDGYDTLYQVGSDHVCAKCIKDLFRVCPDCGKVFTVTKMYDKGIFYRKAESTPEEGEERYSIDIEILEFETLYRQDSSKYGVIYDCPHCHSASKAGKLKNALFKAKYVWSASVTVKMFEEPLAKDSPIVLKYSKASLPKLDISTLEKVPFKK